MRYTFGHLEKNAEKYVDINKVFVWPMFSKYSFPPLSTYFILHLATLKRIEKNKKLDIRLTGKWIAIGVTP